jgi:hypothetical protein
VLSESKSNADRVRNAADCAGVLLFDQWTCNMDARQMLLWRTSKERTWRLSMIDQANCFNGPHWNFPDSPLWGLHHGLEPYVRAKRFELFEPWLDRLERVIDQRTLQSAASRIPPRVVRSRQEGPRPAVRGTRQKTISNSGHDLGYREIVAGECSTIPFARTLKWRAHILHKRRWNQRIDKTHLQVWAERATAPAQVGVITGHRSTPS